MCLNFLEKWMWKEVFPRRCEIVLLDLETFTLNAGLINPHLYTQMWRIHREWSEKQKHTIKTSLSWGQRQVASWLCRQQICKQLCDVITSVWSKFSEECFQHFIKRRVMKLCAMPQLLARSRLRDFTRTIVQINTGHGGVKMTRWLYSITCYQMNH